MFKPKKKDLDRPTTVKDLHDLVDGISEIVVTKGEFTDYTSKAFKTFATKGDLQDLKRELPTKQEMERNTDKILTSNDQIAKKLDKVLTEQASTSGNVDRYRDEVKDIKERVERLETHAGIN